MKLPYEFKQLKRLKLKPASLKDAILERRTVLRDHQAQRGDDRCWIDDYRIFAFLDDSSPTPTHLKMFHIHMSHCKDFHKFCNASAPDPISPERILDPKKWDDDLKNMEEVDLLNHLYFIQQEFLILREIPAKQSRPRNIDDYRRVYNILPEKNLSDFRLPSEGNFLGENLAPKAGCPAFWRSHSNCDQNKKCDVHKWGWECPASITHSAS